MIVKVNSSKIMGKAKAPASKSFTHRAIISAALARGTSTIRNPLASDDTYVTSSVLKDIGIDIKASADVWRVEGGEFKVPKSALFCRESGTTLRFMSAICSLVDGKCTITGARPLLKRPIGELVGAMKQLGAKISSNGDFPPVVTQNSFKGGIATLRGDISSQFVSALLLVAPLGSKNVTIKLSTQLESLPYVKMTLYLQELFGVKVDASKDMRKFVVQPQKYKATNYEVEGDWSSAAFLLAAGALAGEVEVSGLDMKSEQADRSIVQILKKMGADMNFGVRSMTVHKSDLKGIEFDVSNCPDLFPVLCILCSVAKGKSTITGIERLRLKESDRVAEMEKGLLGMGIAFRHVGDYVEIKGARAKGGIINSNDHRIAMAFGILGIVANGETTIRNAECVSKSFPDFWSYMVRLNADMKMVK